jgi:hypothetical protein
MAGAPDGDAASGAAQPAPASVKARDAKETRASGRWGMTAANISDGVRVAKPAGDAGEARRRGIGKTAAATVEALSRL